ncbi:MAG: GC-type dockerin domain-anchored protein [Planctomycetota bacterium]
MPIILQWFELDWRNMEYRMPDFFLAGYNAAWLPPPGQTLSDQSVGYDPLDRFNLGTPSDPTAYGTEQDFRAALDAFHAADAYAYADTIMNHNGFRRADEGFHIEGGYPGFWANPPQGRDLTPIDDWGDFHNSPNPLAYLQSENPGAPNYNTVLGDLVALCDIDQFSQNLFIRQPLEAGNPDNIPGGTLRNLPDPMNERFYQDRTATTPELILNPDTGRMGSDELEVVYSFLPDTPGAETVGTPVLESPSDLIARSSQWRLEVIGVDGFRLDAAKHIQREWWDSSWDPVIHNRWQHPSGVFTTPYSFCENTLGNNQNFNDYIRRPNNAGRPGDGFGNRDALDLPVAGALRNINGANGFASWIDALSGTLDDQDGFNDGTLGVNHVFSHDNGTVGSGNAPPPQPSFRAMAPTEHAWVLLRPGSAIVYHNSRGITRPQNGFWPRQGVPIAMGRAQTDGSLDDTFTNLVQIANQYARGDIDVTSFTDPVVPNVDDTMIFERRENGGVSSLLVGLSDSRSSGTSLRNVATNFPAGTRLHELTGNASDPVIDPNNQIPLIITVPANQRINLVVPNKVSSAGEHEKAFVAYGPAVPIAELEISGVSGTLPDRPFFFPEFAQRINDIPVVTGDSVTLTVTTSQADPLDPNTDDNALFKIGQGYRDLNGNGQVDFPVGLADENSDGVLLFPQEQTVTGGFEQFVDINEPLFTNPGAVNGFYEQTIAGTELEEGLNYLTVNVFRHRDAGLPVFRQIRRVFYYDNTGPEIELVDPLTQTDNGQNIRFNIRALDATTNKVVTFLNLDPAADPVQLAIGTSQVAQEDRFEWSSTLLNVPDGENTLTVVALEETNTATVLTHDFVVGEEAQCLADINGDGQLAADDFNAWLNAFIDGDLIADQNGDGQLLGDDFNAWLSNFFAGC